MSVWDSLFLRMILQGCLLTFSVNTWHSRETDVLLMGKRSNVSSENMIANWRWASQYGSEDISWGSRKNPFIEIPFPDDWHWIFLPSCSVSVKAVYSSFAIWNRAHGHLLISLHPTCFCVQPRLNAERSQYKWRFQSIYLSVQPRLNARDRCKSDFILPVDIFREARRGLSDKYLLRSQRVSPHYLLSQNYSIQSPLNFY